MVGGFKATNLLQIKLYRLYIYVMNLHDVLMYVNISIVCFRNKHRENPRDPTFCLCFWIQGAPHAHLTEGIAGLRPQKNGRKKKSEPPFFKGTSAEIWRNLALNFVKLIQIVVFRCFVVCFFRKMLDRNGCHLYDTNQPTDIESLWLFKALSLHKKSALLSWLSKRSRCQPPQKVSKGWDPHRSGSSMVNSPSLVGWIGRETGIFTVKTHWILSGKIAYAIKREVEK